MTGAPVSSSDTSRAKQEEDGRRAPSHKVVDFSVFTARGAEGRGEEQLQLACGFSSDGGKWSNMQIITIILLEIKTRLQNYTLDCSTA